MDKKVKSPKGNSNSTDMSARFGAELTVEEYVATEVLPETVEVDGTEYNLRGNRLFDKETGEKVGEMNDDGVGVIDPEDF
jgi:pimeloyl-CoA synthetase